MNFSWADDMDDEEAERDKETNEQPPAENVDTSDDKGWTVVKSRRQKNPRNAPPTRGHNHSTSFNN